MIVLLGILIVVWLVSSNIKWVCIAAAAFMLMVGPCRRRQEPPEHQPAITTENQQLSATGLPIAHKQYRNAAPGVLLNGEDW